MAEKWRTSGHLRTCRNALTIGRSPPGGTNIARHMGANPLTSLETAIRCGCHNLAFSEIAMECDSNHCIRFKFTL